MAALKILVIPGSLRTGSFNKQLAGAVVKELLLADIDVTQISLGDFPLPIYDADLETKSGVPQIAVDLKRMIGAHHGVFIVTPEYNSSVPPLLKNSIDWVTRVKERNETLGQVFRERAFALGAASDGKFGGLRVLMALRQILALGCGATVIPTQMGLSFAHQAFGDDGGLKEQRDADLLRATIKQLIDVSQRMM